MKLTSLCSVTFLILTASLLASCSKHKKLLYTLDAFYDSTITTSNTVIVSAEKTGGVDDYVRLSVEGLPDYIQADISSPDNTFPWRTTIIFSFNNAFATKNVSLWKNYTVTVRGITSEGVVRTKEVTFFCYPDDATQAFDGLLFYSHEACAISGSELRAVNVFASGGNSITLNNFFQTTFTSYSVPAIIDKRARTITIPAFTEDYYTFKGSGIFYPTGNDTIACIIHYSRSNASTHDSCTTTMTFTP